MKQVRRIMRNRRVGTFTLGVSMVVTGVLSIISLFTNIVDIFTVMKLSPLILVFLGAEMLFYTFKDDDRVIKYDGMAIFISFVLITGTILSTAAVAFIDHLKLMN